MADIELPSQTPQEIAEEADNYLRSRSRDLPELEIEENVHRLVEGFIEVFKNNPKCQKAVSESYWSKTPPGEKDRFVRFSSASSRYAVQYVPDEIGNICLIIRRRDLAGAVSDDDKERQLEGDPAGYWQASLVISLIRNRTASGDTSTISYIDWKEGLRTGKWYVDNTALVVSRARQILEDLQKPEPPFLPGESSRWQ